MTMMNQPVKNSTGDHIIKENSIPFAVLLFCHIHFDNINNDLHNNNKEHSITKIDLYKQNLGKLH